MLAVCGYDDPAAVLGGTQSALARPVTSGSMSTVITSQGDVGVSRPFDYQSFGGLRARPALS